MTAHRAMFSSSQCVFLRVVSQVLKEQRLKQDEGPKPLRFLQKIEKPVPRPPTPTVAEPPEVSATP